MTGCLIVFECQSRVMIQEFMIHESCCIAIIIIIMMINQANQSFAIHNPIRFGLMIACFAQESAGWQGCDKDRCQGHSHRERSITKAYDQTGICEMVV